MRKKNRSVRRRRRLQHWRRRAGL
jgi:hypothetical protein